MIARQYSGRAVIDMLYARGAPKNLAALRAALAAQRERALWRMYMAQLMQAVTEKMGYDVVPFAALTQAGTQAQTRGTTAESGRTGQDILQSVLGGLRGLGQKEA